MAFLDTTGLTHLVDKLKGIIGTATLATNDKTVKGAINETNLNVQKYSPLVGGFTISAGTDLNTLRTPGFYICANNSTANTIVNSPISYGFKLSVSNGLSARTSEISGEWQTIRQELTTYQNQSFVRFAEADASGVFNFYPWRRVLDASYALTLEEIAASTSLQAHQVPQASALKNGRIIVISASAVNVAAKSTEYISSDTIGAKNGELLIVEYGLVNGIQSYHGGLMPITSHAEQPKLIPVYTYEQYAGTLYIYSETSGRVQVSNNTNQALRIKIFRYGVR